MNTIAISPPRIMYAVYAGAAGRAGYGAAAARSWPQP